MIEGLKITMSSKELNSHLTTRAKYHDERFRWYEQQLTTLKEGGLEENKHCTGDPLSGMQKNLENHKERAAYFLFMAEHVIPDETYRLTENDLRTLEITTKYY